LTADRATCTRIAVSHAAAESSAERTRKAGRGVLSLTGSKLYFIIAGYVVQVLVPRLLGSPEEFGLFAATMGGISILNNVLIAATIQTVSKRISEDASAADTTLRQGLLLQLLVGGGLAAAVFVSAPWLAGDFLLNPKIGPFLRVASIVVLAYALYATLIGSLNGRQLFQQQALLDMTFTTLRTVGIVGLTALGYGVMGATSGFAGAAVALLLIALWKVGLGKAGSQTPLKTWLVLMTPLWLYQLFLNLTLQFDLWVLIRTVTQVGIEHGIAAEVAAKTAAGYAGLYKATQTFAFVPYQLILSVTFVVFPMVSQATSAGDSEATRQTIRGAMRFSLLVLLAIATPIAGAARGVMLIAYPAEYVSGAAALSVLSIGLVCFALFVIAATVLSGAGKAGLAATIAAITVVIVIVGNIVLVRYVGLGEHTLVAAASATSLGTAFALVAVGTAVQLRFGAFIPSLTIVRALLAAGAGFAAAHFMPSSSRIQGLAALVVGGVAYLVTLIATREIGPQEIGALRKVVGR